ncbi:PREDICTED: uricase-like [Crocodylus porosus]|uniref:uricase-like n=1 Tax=Crocodylus porosus TaxID=8502 RepID=UPI000939A442|nr:PREDICTED: uricase-like [Crocodylus porosus]
MSQQQSPVEVEVLNSEYGKNLVKFLYIRREGKRHCIKEVEVCAHIRLNEVKEYFHDDNKDVIPTDTIKNAIYAIAKQKGVQVIEEFALDICNHFISSFCHVLYAKVFIQESPWHRLHQNCVSHAHSFIFAPEGIRFCEVELCRNASPVIFSGIKDLKLMKTTQSGFENFHRDKYTTLPERRDRVLCAELFLKWNYLECTDVDFDCIWNTARECVLEAFSGPPDCGKYSPSYQKTVNDIQMLILEKVPQVDIIETTLNNIFYEIVDMKKLGFPNNKEVLTPVEAPFGTCTCILRRSKCLEAQGQDEGHEKQSAGWTHRHQMS